MESKAGPAPRQPDRNDAKRWSKRIAGYREKLVEFLVLALPTALATRICDQISGSFLRQPWQAVWLLVPLAVVTWLIWQHLKGRREFKINRRFILFLSVYIVMFSVAAATSFLDWNRKITVFGEGAPRSWLAPTRFGDWRYALLRKHSASSHGLIIVTMPSAGGQSVVAARDDIIRIIALAEHLRAKGVALDFFFKKTSALDPLLCQVIDQAKIPVITGYGFDHVDGQVVPTALPESLAACISTEREGHLGGFRDTDHRVRFIPMHYQNRAAFSLIVAREIASLEGRNDAIVPDDELLRFVEPEPPIQTVSYQQLMASRADLRERFVLVGSDRESQETSFGLELGVAIHAGAIHSLLGHHYIRRSRWWLPFGIILVTCYLLTLFTARGLSATKLVGFCSLISLIVVSYSAISIVVGPLWLDVVYPLVAIWLLLALLLPFRLEPVSQIADKGFFLAFQRSRGIRKVASGGLLNSDARALGSDRCAVGAFGAAAGAGTSSRWAWPTVAGHAASVQRRALDLGHWRAVAGATGSLSSLSDLPSPFSTVGTRWCAGTGTARTGRGTGSGGAARSGRSFRGCHLRRREKGGLGVGPTKRGKGTKIVAVSDGHSLPLAVSVQSASPHESQLVEEVLAQSFLDTLPARLIGDKAYDSDRLDRHLLQQYGIELIAPHLRTRRQPTQDGRPLRRYRRRWRIERLFAWLHWFRRLVTRWEYHIENFFGMVRLGCNKLLLRHI